MLYNSSQKLYVHAGTFENPASSCDELAKKIPNFQPGYFWVADSEGQPQLVYCIASTECCDEDGGWMRIAYLDMTEPNQKCPDGFDVVTNPKRACIRTTGEGCTSVKYSTRGIKYTQVCGRVRAYQDSTTDGFEPYHDNNALTLNDGYVDGVIITQGQPIRGHIWTFVANPDDKRIDEHGCPCAGGPFTGTVPSFVDNDYFCESGTDATISSTVFSDDPLWDGQGCPSGNTCCTDRNPPWFCREVDPSTSIIELRVCTNQKSADEDIQLELVEIYVRSTQNKHSYNQHD